MIALGMLLALAFLPASAQGLSGKTPVFVTASFVDRNHLFMENLTKDEVRIYENGKPRQIEFMAAGEVPAVYGILFDRSMLPAFLEESMTRSGISDAAVARSLAYELIDKHLGRQAVWVGAFEKELQVLLDFTQDGFRAKEAIQQLRGNRSQEDSFLYGALFSAVRKMNERQERRRVLIVFLDLLDSETADKLKPLKNLLSASNIEIFFVSTASKLERAQPGRLQPPMSESALRELASATAGEAFFTAAYRDHPEDISRRIYNQIRTFYTFGFLSEAESDKPASLKLECTRPVSEIKTHPLVPVLP